MYVDARYCSPSAVNLDLLLGDKSLHVFARAPSKPVGASCTSGFASRELLCIDRREQNLKSTMCRHMTVRLAAAFAAVACISLVIEGDFLGEGSVCFCH